MIVAFELIDGKHFIAELSTVPRCCGEFLASEREFILRLASDAVFAREIFGCSRHVAAAVSIEQGDHQRVLELPLAQSKTPSRATDHVRRLAHGLNTAGEDD